ncbi:Ubiquitin carboxyl-terminal hydrolase isozyme L5 [Cytospora mali]|uniref:ubiquitinyl hydrolase 1 n=1 Tax=Cytospora mali TaxID=578113 RepID=A0A194V6I2_CYTMA|nr:Ubiquitin carboxyl-terminal hydrolase isozyme L5 [Valsa mali var. pyri (nom. inval.)]
MSSSSAGTKRSATPDDPQEDQKMPRLRLRRSAATKASALISEVTRSETKPEPINLPTGDLLAEALAPIKDDEQDEWKAWVEIESEPAFFNGLLRDLGVQDVKIQEMFSVDEVDFLPKPVLGFVFLCKYAGENEDAQTEVPKDLWFANQTMANGCATVALLNILMNSPDVQLGEKLNQFKADTRDLTSVLRGYRLDSDNELRTKHNAFARRIELLNADLLLSNEYEDCKGVPESEDKPPKGRGNRKLKPKKRPVRKKPRHDEDACHYKAFVPLGGQVWILDGLEYNPVSLGEASDETWISLAMEEIVKKIEVAGEMVNILAVCQSPVVALRKELAVNIKALSASRAAMTDEVRPDEAEDRFYLEGIDEAQLAKYGVTWAMLDRAEPDLSQLTDQVSADLIRQLESEQGRIRSEYMQEMEMVRQDEERCAGRKKTFTPAANLWVKKLAEQGVLERLLDESNA